MKDDRGTIRHSFNSFLEFVNVGAVGAVVGGDNAVFQGEFIFEESIDVGFKVLSLLHNVGIEVEVLVKFGAAVVGDETEEATIEVQPIEDRVFDDIISGTTGGHPFDGIGAFV